MDITATVWKHHYDKQAPNLQATRQCKQKSQHWNELQWLTGQMTAEEERVLLAQAPAVCVILAVAVPCFLYHEMESSISLSHATLVSLN